MASAESMLHTSPQATLYAAQCDPVLSELFQLAGDASVKERLEYLTREFISPVVTATLTTELNRGPRSTYAQLRIQDEAFRELQVVATGKVATHLIRNRQSLLSGSVNVEPVRRLSGYVGAVTRNVLADYMRERFPGRHALDTSLRAVLGSSSDLELWRYRMGIDYVEWRCGRADWKAEHRSPVSLWSNPDLRKRLWNELAATEAARADALREVFSIVGAPMLYADLLDFLSALWKVEDRYRAALLEQAHVRVPYLAAHSIAPESAAVRIGILQEMWTLLRRLSSIQQAVILLRLPPVNDGNFLVEFIRLGIVQEAELARSLGISVDTLMFTIPLLPLDDMDIAALYDVASDEVRRIRQDARRRLERLERLQRRSIQQTGEKRKEE